MWIVTVAIDHGVIVFAAKVHLQARQNSLQRHNEIAHPILE